MTQLNAMLVVMGQMARQLQQQAYLLAMNDAFLLTLAVIFITVLVVLFVIRTPRKRVATALQGTKQGNVASGDEYAKGRADSKAGKKQITVAPQEKISPRERRKDAPMRRFMRRSVVIPAIILAILLVAGVVGYILYNNYNFYSTDDAQVTGTLVNILPPTSGTLVNLDVQAGSYVSARQIIGTVVPTGPQPVQHLVAPVDGIIVQTPGVVGQFVSTETTVAQETDPNSVKVTAYVDESAVNNIADGQAVDIHVDAYNSTITGRVTQIVGATAGQFSLLPTTDNSSGNYTKVGQRVPVYIQLDSSAYGSLLPGMSVEVTIHLH
jgi:hypothetical protein